MWRAQRAVTPSIALWRFDSVRSHSRHRGTSGEARGCNPRLGRFDSDRCLQGRRPHGDGSALLARLGINPYSVRLAGLPHERSLPNR